MASLTNEQKLLIIERLACFVRPIDIKKELQKKYGLDLTLQAIAHYDPNTLEGGTKLAPEWKKLFCEIRERYRAGVADVPIAVQRKRLEILQDLIYEEMDAKLKNRRLIADLIKQASMETGGMFIRDAASPDIDKRIEELLAALVGEGQEAPP